MSVGRLGIVHQRPAIGEVVDLAAVDFDSSVTKSRTFHLSSVEDQPNF